MADYSKLHPELIPTESEADTRARRIDPALRDAGWDTVAGSLITREKIAHGRITVGGRRENPMACDYVLTYNGHKLATVEAKRAGISAAEGVAQAKEGEVLQLGYLLEARVSDFCVAQAKEGELLQLG